MGKITLKEKTNFLKMLTHPTRLMILQEMVKGVKCVNDIGELLKVRQPNISQHLAMLRHGGLVDFYQKGKKKMLFSNKNGNDKNYSKRT